MFDLRFNLNAECAKFILNLVLRFLPLLYGAKAFVLLDRVLHDGDLHVIGWGEGP